MASADTKVLVIGVTGFIGGSILEALLASPHPKLRDAQYSVLLRDEDGSRSAKVTEKYGDRVKPIKFSGLDDVEHVEKIASEHDIIINSAIGFHPTHGSDLVRGVSKRAKRSGAPEPLVIHTSGTSNLADQPMTGTAYPDREFDDANGTQTYDYEIVEDEKNPYMQRTPELNMIKTGIEKGVRTLVIMSPTIYGHGNGLFNQTSIQIPLVVKFVMGRGKGCSIGDGSGVWDHVHVEDLAVLYTLFVEKHLDDPSQLPTGKEGIVFSGVGRHSWKQFFQNVADALYAKSYIKSAELDQISLEEATPIFGNAEMVEAGLTSNSKTVASVAKRLGWKPKHGPDSFKNGYEEEVDKAAAGIGAPGFAAQLSK